MLDCMHTYQHNTAISCNMFTNINPNQVWDLMGTDMWRSRWVNSIIGSMRVVECSATGLVGFFTWALYCFEFCSIYILLMLQLQTKIIRKFLIVWHFVSPMVDYKREFSNSVLFTTIHCIVINVCNYCLLSSFLLLLE